ncbi:MAG: hypothetical protein ACLP81_03155 [Acidimicrobiales bacterium]
MKRAATAKGQARVSIVLDGPDPVGSAAWDRLAQRTALELSSAGEPAAVRVGMHGDPTVTYYGDPGPLQLFPASYAARRAFARPEPQALPATSSPVAGSTDLRSLVASYGL